MTTPLYALAIVGIGVASVLSYQKVEMEQAELDKTNGLKDRISVLDSQNAKDQRRFDVMPAKSEAVKSELVELRADLETQELELSSLEANVKQLTAKSKTQEAALVEAEGIIAKFEEAFKGENIPVSGIADYVSQLKEDEQGLEAELEETVTVAEVAQTKLDSGENVLADFRKREVERARNLSQNSISSLITAVNADWGFVVIKPHPGAVITSDSQLIVVRGGKSLGRLSINAVEPNRVIADINYDSLAAGARVRAGDRVILAQTLSR